MFFTISCWSQSFPVTGQLASTAFPVCGTNVFNQSVVPLGSTTSLQVPGCDGLYPDVNPFWYSFTCFTSGTLAFVITPNDLSDDYDWMLFDITGRNPNDAYTDVSLVVTGNWTGTDGRTGAAAGGSNVIQCASQPAQNNPTFSTMPYLIKGHNYLLLISHFTQSQSGYRLSFGGGTAVITDPKQPHLSSTIIACDGKSIVVVLNKQMRCASLAKDGSDFLISSYAGSITSASSTSCENGFDMDTVKLTLSDPLAPGNYSLAAKNGSDGNTLLDDCNTGIPVGESVSFTVSPRRVTPLDSISPVTCAPNSVTLLFSDPIQCSSIADDNSDFVISGSPAIAIASVSGNCSFGLTNVINIRFTQPVVKEGNYQIMLVNGTDGNTIIDQCGLATPAGSTISFSTKDTVSAFFTSVNEYGCKYDTIQVGYQLANGVNEWQWNIDSSFNSSLFTPSITDSVFGMHRIEHIVSNGFCSDTVSETINLDNTLKAAFQRPQEVCPKDLIMLNDESIGQIISWNWSYGDGETSTQKIPPDHLYPNTEGEKIYNVSLVVENNMGCFDTATASVIKLQSCYITVPNAFTPNGDGKNDYLYPLNAFQASNLEFRVFNRYGQLVFETRDWTHKWDGTVSGAPQPVGTYVWMLSYTDGPSGKRFSLRGTSVLIR
jgi:gliding motility-associated-like protein